MKRIILLSGYARSGKDFVGKHITISKQLAKQDVEIMFFAEPMKRILAKTMGVAPSTLDKYKNSPNVSIQTHDSFGKVGTTTVRNMLQLFGSEAMKSEFGDDVWAELLLKRVKQSDADVIVVTDWRFKSEYFSLFDNAHEDISLHTVRITREGLVNTHTHVSEIDLDDGIDFDYEIKNNGVSILSLTRQVNKMLKEIME